MRLLRLLLSLLLSAAPAQAALKGRVAPAENAPLGLALVPAQTPSLAPVPSLAAPARVNPEASLGPALPAPAVAVEAPAEAPRILLPEDERPGTGALERLAKMRQGDAIPAARLNALFDGLAADSSREGQSMTGRLRVGAPETSPAALETARARTLSAVESAREVVAQAVKARPYQGRALTLHDPACGVAAPVLGVLLRHAGVPVDAVEAEFHVYLAHQAGGELLIVDPTIRQFFGGRRAPKDIPRVFVGTLGELTALFERHADDKTTRYDVKRIYFSDAVVRNSLLKEAAGLAAKAGAAGNSLLTADEALDVATYLPLARALRRN